MKNTRIKFNLKNSKVIAINLSTDLQISFSEIKDYLKDFNIDLVEMVKTHDNEKTILTINGGTIIFLDNLISEEEENRRYQEQISKLESEINRSETILKNADFLARAPKEKIELEQKKYLEFKKQYNELVEVLQKNLNQNKK
jgi:valyl-tRNA synthetase